MAWNQAARWGTVAAIGVAGLMLAGGAQARSDVAWSVGIGAPGAQVVVGNAPVYVAPPMIVQAPPRYYAPAPVYQAAPVYYAPPPPVYYQPRAVYYGPQPYFYGPRHGWRHERHERGERGWRR